LGELGGWLSRTPRSLSVSPPLRPENKLVIHEAGMKPRQSFYLMAVRMVSNKNDAEEHASGAEK
jgi:hypothetical protein